MSSTIEKNKILQIENQKILFKDKKMTDYIVVHRSDSIEKITDRPQLNIYSVMVSRDKALRNKILKNYEWDLSGINTLPFAEYVEKNNKSKIKYSKNNTKISNYSAIPFAVKRTFENWESDCIEINEEFRYYYNLFDSGDGKLSRIQEDGFRNEIAAIKGSVVYVKKLELKKFLAVKDLDLIILFEGNAHSNKTLNQIQLSTTKNKKNCSTKKQNWQLQIYENKDTHGGPKTSSRMLGKILISPLAKSKVCPADYDENESKYVEYLIGIDVRGYNISHTCDPRKVPEKNYLIPVYFSKNVLYEYYGKPSKYIVDDGHISGIGLRTNIYSGEDYISVYLGDLGTELTYKQQLHWLSNNIPPPAVTDYTYQQRDLYCKFLDPQELGEKFKKSYIELQNICEQKLGWKILQKLSQNDRYRFDIIRTVSSREIKDFNEFILNLNIIVVESLNIEEMANLAFGKSPWEKYNRDFLSRFEKILQKLGIEHYESQINKMQILRRIRNHTVHRKNNKSQMILHDLIKPNTDYVSASREILDSSLKFLEYLKNIVENDYFNIHD